MQAFQQALRIDPNYAFGWNNLGVAQSKVDAVGNEAAESYLNAIRLDPKLAEAWENLAVFFTKRRNYGDAGPAAKRLTELEPTNPDGWIFLAGCAESQENWEQVVEYYHQAVDVLELRGSFIKDPHDLALVYANYGNGCSKIGHYLDAEKLLNQAIIYDPTSSDAWDDLGFMQFLQGKAQEALASIHKGLALNPDAAGGWVTLGLIESNSLNQPAAAEQAFQKAVAIQPSYSGAWYGLGKAEQLLQKMDAAVQAYRKAVEATPSYLEAWQKLAAITPDPLEADQAISKAISLDPQNAQTYSIQGTVLVRRQDWLGAEKALRQALAVANDNATNWNILFLTLFKQQRYLEAVEAEQKALQFGTSSPPQTLAFYWGGIAEAHIYQAHDKGGGAPEWEAALNALNQAVALDPKHGVFWYEMELCAQALGRTDAAATAAIQFKALGGRPSLLPGINSPARSVPNSAMAASNPMVSPESINQANAIKLLLASKRFDEALSQAQASTQKFPSDPVAWYVLGDVLMNMKRYSEAGPCLTKSITLDPKMGPAWFDLGNSLAYLQKFNDAIPALITSIDNMPNYPLSWEALAQCYYLTNNTAGGIASLQKLLQTHPDSGYGWCALADLEKTQGTLNAAEADLTKAVGLQPNYSHAWNTLGLVYKDEREPAQAIASFQKATLTDPTNAEAWNNLGYTYFSSNESDQAINAYQQALKINPRHGLALYNLAAAYEQRKQWALAQQACNSLAEVNPAQAEHLRALIPGSP